MPAARISGKGQVTLPAAIRRRLGLKADSRVDIELRGSEIVIRPMRSLSELRGVFRHCAADGPMDWEKVRTATELAVAEEVARE